MKIPDWLQPINRRRRIHADEIRVHFTIDTSRFERVMATAAEHTAQADEAFREMAYSHRLEEQADLALFELDTLLDEWAAEVGFNREAEARARRDARVAARRQRILERQDPKHPDFIGQRT